MSQAECPLFGVRMSHIKFRTTRIPLVQRTIDTVHRCQHPDRWLLPWVSQALRRLTPFRPCNPIGPVGNDHLLAASLACMPLKEPAVLNADSACKHSFHRRGKEWRAIVNLDPGTPRVEIG